MEYDGRHRQYRGIGESQQNREYVPEVQLLYSITNVFVKTFVESQDFFL